MPEKVASIEGLTQKFKEQTEYLKILLRCQADLMPYDKMVALAIEPSITQAAQKRKATIQEILEVCG